MRTLEIATSSIDMIISFGYDDGYELSRHEAEKIREAAKLGSLLWTRRHIVSTMCGNEFTLMPTGPR